MAESAVNFLIEYLGPLLVDEVKLLKGVRGEVRKIRDELESMRAFLRDAEAKEHHNEGIKAWVRQVIKGKISSSHRFKIPSYSFIRHSRGK
ncbi:hypothetical protein ACLOJK_039120 [Asimina triloba]